MRIAVAADQALIRQAVRAALLDRGQDVVVLEWHGSVVVPRPRRAPAGPADAGTDVGASRVGLYTRLDAALLVSDLDRWDLLIDARTVMRRVPVPWVGLTGAPRGARWGALIEAGACAVLPDDSSLDIVLETLELASTGHDLAGPGGRVLRQDWEELLREHGRLSREIASLTPAQRTVLELLYAGHTVTRIADLLEVSTTSVRTQVKAIRDKLGVNSQLAAVASYRHLMELDGTTRTGGVRS